MVEIADGRPVSQSPNIFCFISRRCCASSDSVAVGRASRRPRPMGSPVSSQIAVVAGLDARQRLRDLLQQLALAVARAQLQRMLFLDRGAVGRVGHDRGVLAQVLGGLAGVGQQVVLQRAAGGRGRTRAACRSCTRRSGMASSSASVSSRPVLCFQALASFGSALAAGFRASSAWSVAVRASGLGGANRSAKRWPWRQALQRRWRCGRGCGGGHCRSSPAAAAVRASAHRFGGRRRRRVWHGS